MPTGINWTDETWNTIVGCSKISPGCKNCYAAEAAKSARLQQFEQYQAVKDWNGSIAFVESALEKPFKWKKPKKIFVCSMSDLFHENVTDEMRDRIFATIKLCPQHTFQVLTKRPENAVKYFTKETQDRITNAFFTKSIVEFPLKNVWIGTTVENQEMAEKRIPYLLQIPAAKRWLSMEPLLEDVNLTCDEMMIRYIEDGFYRKQEQEKWGAWEDFHFLKAIDWAVVGGESGANARPCDRRWIESIVNQCQSANVPVWVKQLGSNSVIDDERVKLPVSDRAWSKLENLPQHLQIREFPKN